MNRKIFFLLLILIIIFFAGCQQTPPQTTPDKTTPDKTPEEISDEIQDVPTLRKEAIKLIKDKDFMNALQFVNKALTVEQNDDLYLIRAYIFTKINSNQDAYKDLQEAMKTVKSDEKKAVMYGMLAYLYDEKGDDVKSMAAVREFEKSEGKISEKSQRWDFPADYGTIGRVLANNGGEYEKAIKYFDKVIKDNPQKIELLYERGYTYYRTGNKEKAVGDINAWIKADKKYTVKDKHFAIAYMILGEYDKSLDYVNKAMKAEPHDFTLYTDRADIYAEKGDKNAAQEDLETVMKKYPDENSYERKFAKKIADKIKDKR